MGKRKKHHRCKDHDPRDQRETGKARNHQLTVIKTVFVLMFLAQPEVQRYLEIVQTIA